jgi:hypothetical protein
MSRSRPEVNLKNPATKWIEWDGDNGGFRYYDKEKKENIRIDPAKMPFMVLGQAYSIGGFNEADKSNLTSNQIRDTRKEVLTVKIYPNNLVAKGLYADIKDTIKANGGKFMVNIYAAVKAAGGYTIVVVQLKGAAFSEWLEFKKTHKVDVDTVMVSDIKEGKKGKITYKVPVFKMVPASEEANKAAFDLDVIVQDYLDSVAGDAPESAAPTPTSFEEEHDSTPQERDMLADEIARQTANAERKDEGPLFTDDDDDQLPF